jgi:hypothetical protein
LILARGVIALSAKRGDYDPAEFTRTYAATINA